MRDRWTWERLADGTARVKDASGDTVCVVATEYHAALIAAAPAWADFAAGARRLLVDNANDLAFLLQQLPDVPSEHTMKHRGGGRQP